MKSEITLEIEKALSKRFQGTGERYSSEICVSYVNGGKFESGIVDFVTSKHDFLDDIPKITCYEIKVSYSDMKSEHGHTLVGDNNYYVLTKELLEEIGEKNPNLIMGDMGILVYKDGSLRQVRDSKPGLLKRKLTIESRFRILDQMLMRWQNNRNN